MMGRWMYAPTISLIFILSVFALASAFVAPALAIIALAGCVLTLLWERYRLARAMRALAHRFHHTPLDAKLEVGSGAWGEVCHAVNRLLQQWRTEQHLQRLQPTQPALRQINPLNLHPPVNGHDAAIAVLAVGQLHLANELDEMRARTHLISEPVERQQALLQWRDSSVLLIFGALAGEADPMRSAVAAATNIIACAEAAGLPIPPMALSSGHGRVAVVPLIGLHTIGEPLEQAANLIHQTAPGTLICAEEAYFYLRSAGLPPLSAVRFTTPARSYALALGDTCLHQKAE